MNRKSKRIKLELPKLCECGKKLSTNPLDVFCLECDPEFADSPKNWTRIANEYRNKLSVYEGQEFLIIRANLKVDFTRCYRENEEQARESFSYIIMALQHLMSDCVGMFNVAEIDTDRKAVATRTALGNTVVNLKMQKIIINRIFMDFEFPDSLKISKVKPIYKSGPKSDMGNLLFSGLLHHQRSRKSF